MAELEDVHVMEMDRETSKLECVRINPTRAFAKMTERGTAIYTWQKGKWFGTGGHSIDDDEVPLEFRRSIEDTPVTAGKVQGPEVTWTCTFCGEQMNYSDHDAHLIAHVNATLKAAGAIAPPTPTPMDKGERQVTAKNTHSGA